MSKWKVGDTLKFKEKGQTVEGEIESIAKPTKVGKFKTRWAKVLVQQRRRVDLELYKPPAKRKEKKQHGKEEATNAR